MIAIDVTPDEIQRGKLVQGHVDTAIRALQEDGFVVLNNVIDLSHLEMLRARMLEDLCANPGSRGCAV